MIVQSHWTVATISVLVAAVAATQAPTTMEQQWVEEEQDDSNNRQPRKGSLKEFFQMAKEKERKYHKSVEQQNETETSKPSKDDSAERASSTDNDDSEPSSATIRGEHDNNDVTTDTTDSDTTSSSDSQDLGASDDPTSEPEASSHQQQHVTAKLSTERDSETIDLDDGPSATSVKTTTTATAQDSHVQANEAEKKPRKGSLADFVQTAKEKQRPPRGASSTADSSRRRRDETHSSNKSPEGSGHSQIDETESDSNLQSNDEVSSSIQSTSVQDDLPSSKEQPTSTKSPNDDATTHSNPKENTDAAPIESSSSDEEPAKLRKGSLAEFFQKAKEKERPSPSSEENEISTTKASGQVSQSESPVLTETATMLPKNETNESVQTDKHPETVVHNQSLPDFQQQRCGTSWGKLERRRPADLSILYQLFKNITTEDEANYTQSIDARESAIRHRAEKLQRPNNKADKRTNAKTSSASGDATTTDSSEGASGTKFVEEIDQLFEGIDAPDELDLGAGTSLQQVVMGSATRMVLKRVVRGARFVKKKIVGASERFTKSLKDGNGNLAPLRKLRDKDGRLIPLKLVFNEDGDFAPLHLLRDQDGNFAPFYRLRDNDGTISPPSKDQWLGALKRVGKTGIALYHKIDQVFTKIFAGDDEMDELDFSFLADAGVRNENE